MQYGLRETLGIIFSIIEYNIKLSDQILSSKIKHKRKVSIIRRFFPQQSRRCIEEEANHSLDHAFRAWLRSKRHN